MGTLSQTLVLALLFSLTVFVHILSCALYQNWWPLIIFVGYGLLFCAYTCCICSRGDGVFDSGNKTAQHWAEFWTWFLISGVVGVPFVMWHVDIIELGAALMDLSGFLLASATVSLFLFFSRAHEEGFGGGLPFRR